MTAPLCLGYIPLVDAAPLIVALEFGFAEEEGLPLVLSRATSWSMLRDMLDFGQVDAAHMLSVMVVARALGLGGGGPALEALMVLSLNGQVFGLSPKLPALPFDDPVAAGRVLAGAQLALSGSAIWSRAPDKVLAARHGWAERDPATAGKLMRALWRAGRWAADPANHTTLAEVLARPGYLDVSSDLVDRTLSQRVLVTPQGPELHIRQFQTFHAGAANFPWRSQAAWIGSRLAGRLGLDAGDAMARARGVSQRSFPQACRPGRCRPCRAHRTRPKARWTATIRCPQCRGR